MQADSSLSDAEIQTILERAFDPGPPGESFERLQGAGARVVPFALAALNHPRIETHAWHLDSIMNYASALRRVLWLLGGNCPPEAVAPLTRLTLVQDCFLRENAAGILAGISRGAFAVRRPVLRC